jgi:ribosomal protein S18 acetylase RimI-like enzyme
LGEEHATKSTEIVGRAFQNDPLFVYGCPDPEARARYLPRLFMWSVWRGLLFGELLGTDGDLDGVAAIIGPASGDLSMEQIDKIGYSQNRELVGPDVWDPATAALNRVFAPIDAELHRSVPEPHWYLDAIAVDPARQGQGIGGRLLDAVNRRADEDDIPIVLLTLQPRNLPLYERYGYETVCGGTEKSSGLAWWGMRRQAVMR